MKYMDSQEAKSLRYLGQIVDFRLNYCIEGKNLKIKSSGRKSQYRICGTLILTVHNLSLNKSSLPANARLMLGVLTHSKNQKAPEGE